MWFSRKTPVTVVLEQIVPWGRSYDEYCHMFDLQKSDLRGRILGAGDGPASFNAEMNRMGYDVVSVDPIYAFSEQQIKARIDVVYADMIDQLKTHPEGFIWERFRDPDALGQHRMAAMRMFLADFETGKRQGRYLEGELPVLPFADQTFDLAVCSHLLFLYSGHLSLDFHVRSVQELCRVAHEVRLFPTLTMECKLSPYIEPIRAELQANGYHVELQTVDYEFQIGGNQMMRVIPPGNATYVR
jgi:SAM-dependent methyltransferase